MIRIVHVPLDELAAMRRAPAPRIDAPELGYLSPIFVDERTGLLYAAAGRIEALIEARDSGAQPPPRVVVRDGVWTVPLVRGMTFKNETTAKQYVLADNGRGKAKPHRKRAGM